MFVKTVMWDSNVKSATSQTDTVTIHLTQRGDQPTKFKVLLNHPKFNYVYHVKYKKCTDKAKVTLTTLPYTEYEIEGVSSGITIDGKITFTANLNTTYIIHLSRTGYSNITIRLLIKS